ncbi:MAG: 3D domain-containing protein [Chthoniobacterales bacterium]
MNKQTTSRLSRTAAVLVAAILPACSTSNAVSRQTAPTPAKAAAAKPAKTVPVVATAYGASAKCNSKWAGKNATGGRLKFGEVTSAAADWSRFPVGTKFRVKETGRVYVVDDYGSAMVGKDKVDLFKTNYREVYRWGVRNVQLEIIEWGDFAKSLAILKPRSKSRHVRSMVQSLEAKLRNGQTERAG